MISATWQHTSITVTCTLCWDTHSSDVYVRCMFVILMGKILTVVKVAFFFSSNVLSKLLILIIDSKLISIRLPGIKKNKKKRWCCCWRSPEWKEGKVVEVTEVRQLRNIQLNSHKRVCFYWNSAGRYSLFTTPSHTWRWNWKPNESQYLSTSWHWTSKAPALV